MQAFSACPLREVAEWALVPSLPLVCLVSYVQVWVRLFGRRRAQLKAMLPSVRVVLGARVLALRWQVAIRGWVRRVGVPVPWRVVRAG